MDPRSTHGGIHNKEQGLRTTTITAFDSHYKVDIIVTNKPDIPINYVKHDIAAFITANTAYPLLAYIRMDYLLLAMLTILSACPMTFATPPPSHQ